MKVNQYTLNFLYRNVNDMNGTIERNVERHGRVFPICLPNYIVWRFLGKQVKCMTCPVDIEETGEDYFVDHYEAIDD